MKPTKTTETEVLKVYDAWLQSYLNGDVKTYNQYLDDDYHFIGSTNNEEFLNRKDTTAFFKATADQLAGKTELSNTIRTVESFDGLIFITELFDAYFRMDSEWNYYGRFRFSSTLRKNKEGWRFIYQHFSMPDSKAQDGETIGYDKISAENLQLREAVKRRTFELEQKNRSLEIEFALQRVRTSAMAMEASTDLNGPISVLFNEMENLGITMIRCGIGIFNDDSDKVNVWSASEDADENIANLSGDEHLTGHPLLSGIYEHWKKQENYSYILKGQDLIEYYNVTSNTNFPVKPPSDIDKEPRQYYYCVMFPAGGYFVFRDQPFTEEIKMVMKRFSEVFHLAFIRHKDLMKAETQAREATVEIALERIRSKSLAMTKSSDLLDIVVTMRNEFIKLGHEANYFWHMMWLPDKYEKAMTSGDGTRIGFVMELPRHIHGDIPLLAKWEESNDAIVIYPMDAEAAVNYIDKMIRLGDFQNIDPQAPSHEDVRHIGGLTFIMARTTHGEIGYSLPGVVKNPPKEDLDILEKFAGAFDLAHRRFLDLQKAEMQARETQIELALEKVRSRTMGMQRSDELRDTAMLLFQQVEELGINSFACGFNIWDDDKKFATAWMASKNRLQPPFKTNSSEDVYLLFYEAEKRGESLFILEQKGKKLAEHYKYLVSIPEVKALAKAGLSFPTFQIIHCAYFSKGYLMFITHEPVLDAHDIFKRFAKVFEQTYTRFLDLQKAEAQTREAQINLAVERVRAKALAMHKSEEIMEVVAKLKDEVMNLDIRDVIAATIFLKEGDDSVRMWDLSSLEKNNDGYQIPFDITFKLKKSDPNLYVKRVWENPENYFLELQEAKDFKRIIAWLRENDKSQVADEVEEFIETTHLKQLHHAVKKLNNGKLVIDLLNPPSGEMETILTKMGAAFDLAYKRFEDLKNSEAQLKEAKIEAALEKVRSRSLSMYKSEEIGEVVWTVVEKMKELNVTLNGISLVTFLPDSKGLYHWHVNPEIMGNSSKMLLPYFDDLICNDCISAREKGLELFSKVYTKKQKNRYFNKAVDVSDFKYFPEELKQWVLDQPLMSFSYAIQNNSGIFLEDYNGRVFSKEENDLLLRFSKVFEQSYVRFLDLKKAEAQVLRAENDLITIKTARRKAEEALAELQHTQKQLIQSEKMASLGELTAGIAHEIQNPLNFVNNFSEVSNELIDEMNAEIEKGDLEEAKFIMADIKSNLEKINHHGKRADAIVKGMLQHSRTSSAEKEPTDINKLADEYLRLAYHGLRAKDKDFNATLETNYDENIGKIAVISQDLGRVILNLITNAFYACNEKKKSEDSNYEPTVSVSTKKLTDSITISVKDNGNGIPKHVLDKIFQPFFTTKPTGQGTGLGLSLSYDIIKAHGGEIKTESCDGESATFIIKVPIT